MPFKTPEEFFLGQAAEPATGSFDPMSYMKDNLEEPGMWLHYCYYFLAAC
jgi:bifunctional polynucleotide phosphatase/kinase